MCSQKTAGKKSHTKTLINYKTHPILKWSALLVKVDSKAKTSLQSKNTEITGMFIYEMVENI